VEGRDADAAGLRRELRARLGRIGTPLQLLAEGVLGEEDARIDWVAVDPGGRVCVALVDTGGSSEQELLVRGLVQRAWVHARIGDWLQLAPGLAARPDLRPRLLLLAPAFSRLARLAAREADPEGISLATYRWSHAGDSAELLVEPLELPPAVAAGSGAPAAAPLVSVFRSGLTERDFGGNGGSKPS
jgi:hypothetical protein